MRLPDWKSRLLDYLNDAVRRPFGYGTHDCCLFAAGAVEATTGIDPAAAFRGRYSTLKGGIKAVRKAGFSDYVGMAIAQLDSVHASCATPGDLAVIDTPNGPVLGVVQGEGVYVLGVERMGLMPVASARLILAVT
jgi:hypothetical protein